MFAELTKGQDMQNPTITPEAVVDAITGAFPVSMESIRKLWTTLTKPCWG